MQFYDEVKMDHCRKIWFYTPAQEAGSVVGIIGIFAAIVAALAFI